MNGSTKTVGSPNAAAASRLGRLEAGPQVGQLADDAHAPPAAPRRGLDEHGQVGVGHGGRIEGGQHRHSGR